MLVYRICDQSEIDEIFGLQSFNMIGCLGKNTKGNTNNYIPGKLYMHFFPRKDYLMLLDTRKNSYICTYDIPNDILETHLGSGTYTDYNHYQNVWTVDEYAIESEMIRLDYLIRVEMVLKDIDYEDYTFDPTLCSFLKEVYSNWQNKVLKKHS